MSRSFIWTLSFSTYLSNLLFCSSFPNIPHILFPFYVDTIEQFGAKLMVMKIEAEMPRSGKNDKKTKPLVQWLALSWNAEGLSLGTILRKYQLNSEKDEVPLKEKSLPIPEWDEFEQIS